MTAAVRPATPVGPDGLSSAEAAARLQADGPNALQLARPVRLWRLVLHELRSSVIVVLLVAAVLTAVIGDVTDMSVIIAVIVLNTALGAGQEYRSGKELEALGRLTAPRATVRRDGRPWDIPAAEVVRGDLLVLNAGDIVAADGSVTEAEALQLDESAMTGESLPVDRRAGEPVQAGTVVTRGRALAVVEQTGAATALGRIGASLGGRATVTPLQRQLSVLGRQLAVAASAAALVLAAVALALGKDVETSIVLALSLAVAAIPESLPAVLALSLALAARRMSRRGVLVRRPSAVEALGSVTVLAADKTGTLTEGRMRPAAVVGDDRHELLVAAALCNDAAAEDVGPRDDPTETALVLAAREAGIDVAAVRHDRPRVGSVPFDAATGMMTTQHRTEGGGRIWYRKGSPEAIASVVEDDTILDAARGHAAVGERVLAVAVSDDGTTWRPLGLIALADPVRADAAATAATFRGAGVRIVMITGDHPATATAVARAAGIAESDVHARVLPHDKAAIVRDLRGRGEVVAMTGDGVNDAPAMRAADLGVAMGARGTEVAKQAADLVLTRDDLDVLVPALAEGRRAWDNLRRFLHYALTGGVAEVVIMLLGPAVGLGVPLRSGQILWINLLTHGLPGVALGNEPAAHDVLRRPPRPPQTRLVDRGVAGRITVLAVVVSAVSLVAGVLAHDASGTVFAGLTVAQLGVALGLRGSWRRGERNPALLGAVVLNLGLLAAALWWSPLQRLLHTGSIGVRDSLLALACAVPPTVLAWTQRGRRPAAGPTPQ
ncbi:MAG: cation-translocating P-type ATPase [Jatrophihabitans sp.]|uniref:cation-translocating P-type ATPase n=1 Tax=Jatrophihabitans sp. TaxID=1932789 RepID=UPI003F7E1BB2